MPGRLIQDTKREIENYYENLIERNFLPFAALSDYGVLCFDVNENKKDTDYPVVSFDHEDGYEDFEPYSENFISMFHEFEDNLDEWIHNKRKKTLHNKAYSLYQENWLSCIASSPFFVMV